MTFKSIIVPQVDKLGNQLWESDPSLTSSQLVTMAHPRTGSPTRFLILYKSVNDSKDITWNKIFELTRVDGNGIFPENLRPDQIANRKARSLLFSCNYILQDPSIIISSPISPLFFVLPTLFSHNKNFLTALDLHESGESNLSSECQFIPFDLFEQCLEIVCEKLDNVTDTTIFYRLSSSKLLQHLNSIRTRVIKSLPDSLYSRFITNGLTPLDNSSIPTEILDLALKRLSMSFICTYMNHQLSLQYMSSEDFKPLDDYISNLSLNKVEAKLAQEALNNPLNGSKRPGDANQGNDLKKKKIATKSKGPKGLAKVDSSQMKSIMGFFKPKN